MYWTLLLFIRARGPESLNPVQLPLLPTSAPPGTGISREGNGEPKVCLADRPHTAEKSVLSLSTSSLSSSVRNLGLVAFSSVLAAWADS